MSSDDEVRYVLSMCRESVLGFRYVRLLPLNSAPVREAGKLESCIRKVAKNLSKASGIEMSMDPPEVDDTPRYRYEFDPEDCAYVAEELDSLAHLTRHAMTLRLDRVPASVDRAYTSAIHVLPLRGESLAFALMERAIAKGYWRADVCADMEDAISALGIGVQLPRPPGAHS